MDIKGEGGARNSARLTPVGMVVARAARHAPEATIEGKKRDAHLNELVAVGRASARNLNGSAIRTCNTVAITIQRRSSHREHIVPGYTRERLNGTHPVPVGLTPGEMPNSGTSAALTSRRTGRERTEAAMAAAARMAVENFMMVVYVGCGVVSCTNERRGSGPSGK